MHQFYKKIRNVTFITCYLLLLLHQEKLLTGRQDLELRLQMPLRELKIQGNRANPLLLYKMLALENCQLSICAFLLPSKIINLFVSSDSGYGIIITSYNFTKLSIVLITLYCSVLLQDSDTGSQSDPGLPSTSNFRFLLPILITAFVLGEIMVTKCISLKMQSVC